MQQLSQNYRNDGTEGLEPEVKQYLDETYLHHLKNLEQPNPKLLVVFSGGNAVGKTTLAQKIGDKFGGLIIENDAMKRQLLQAYPGLERIPLNQLIWRYTMDLYKRLDDVTPNGLIIRDGIIDWYFDRILPIFEKAGYSLFIIGFTVSQKKAIELIRKRGDTPTVKEERFYQLLDDHAIHIRRFRELYTPDVELTDADLFDHDQVLAKLAKRLETL